MKLTLPKWYDLHTHFRQGPNLPAYVKAHLEMGCAGALAMPNTQPPVSRAIGENTATSWSIESYAKSIREAGGDAFDQLIVPLYLTRETTPEMIYEGAESGLLRACKYYPPHGTTNSQHGLPIDELLKGKVLHAMEDAGVILCIHGEKHEQSGPDYFDANSNAERSFYEEFMPTLLGLHPDLKIVCEHITTRAAVSFVEHAGDKVGATVTPQHLLFTIGNLVENLNPQLYCKPLLKFEEDRHALQAAVTRADQSQIFAGTDSAPHTTKATECGCAAGCFTGGCAPQMYAMGFEAAGADLSTDGSRQAFEKFLCTNGPAFYGFPSSSETFEIVRENSLTEILEAVEGSVTPLPYGLNMSLDWALK